jgi:hypothetical protein
LAPAAQPLAYPHGTRTGIEIVDEVLETLEDRDVNRFLGIYQFTEIPCTGEGPNEIGLVRCEFGAPIGTLTPAIALGACNGPFYGVYRKAREELDPNIVVRGAGNFPPRQPLVYAVIRGNVLPYDTGLPVAYLLVFAGGELIGVGETGVTFFETACRWSAPDVLWSLMNRYGSLDFVLAPR